MDYRKYYKGEFWPKDKKKQKLFGLLKFQDGVAFIDLYGSFFSPEEKVIEIELIYGLLENNHFCIFHNCKHQRPSPLRTSHFLNFEFFVHAPRHLFKPTKDDKLEFTSAKFRFDFLSDWTGINVFSPCFENGKTWVTVEQPDLSELVLFENDNLLLRIDHDYSMPISNPFSSFELRQESWLIAEINGELDFNGVFLFLEDKEDVFTLLNGKEILLITPFMLYTKSGNEFFCFKNRINARFEPIVLSESNRLIHVPVFNLNQLNSLGVVKVFFENWSTEITRYPDSIKSIISCFKQRNLNPESTFLNLVFAFEKIIEVDSRKIADKNIMTSDELKHLSVLEKNGIPKNTVKFFSARLSKKSGKKLKEKISGYLFQFDCSWDQLIGKEHELFINKLVDSRNHLAHLCDACKYQMSPQEFPSFNKKLLKVLYLIIFSKMGLPKDEIIKNLRTNPNIAFES